MNDAQREILERVQRLERQNRRLRRLLALGLLAVGGALLLGNAPAGSETVTARAFVLRDARGVERASWRVAGDGSVVLSMRARGNPRLSIGVRPDGCPRIVLRDFENRPRIKMTGYLGGQFGLSLHGKGKSPRVSLYTDKNQDPRLTFLDRDGKPRLRLGVLSDDTPHVSLLDPGQQTLAALYVDPARAARLELFRGTRAAVRLAAAPTGARGLVIYDPTGKPRVGLGIDSSEKPSLVLFGDRGPTGKPLFKAP